MVIVDFEEKARYILEIINFIDYSNPLDDYNIDLITQLFFIMYDDILTEYQLNNMAVIDSNNKYSLSKDGEFTELFHNLVAAINKGSDSFHYVIVKALEKYDRFEILIHMKQIEKESNY